MPKLYTVKSLAEMFEKDEETIRCWFREGVFPGSFKIKDGWYLKQEDLDKITNQKNDPGNNAGSSRRGTGRFVREW